MKYTGVQTEVQKQIEEYIGLTIKKMQEEIGSTHRRITDLRFRIEILESQLMENSRSKVSKSPYEPRKLGSR